jgi:tetratricopeptide (TPR) repeat protein
MKRLLLSLAFLSLTSLGFAQKKTDYSTIPSMVKEAKEKGSTNFADSLAQDYIDNYLFKLKKDELYTKENLGFMGDFLGDENSKAFKLFMKEPEKLNAVLGPYQAQKKVMFAIHKNYLPKDDPEKTDKPDWNALEKVVVGKFGVLGKEITRGSGMCYYANNKDWKNFGIWYHKYFEIALKHSIYHVNNFSWAVFENVNDPKVLLLACEAIKYSLENNDQNNIEAYDTYANLLYKTGNREEAMKWEERAVKLSNQGEVYVQTLEKMKNDIKTWKETANNP